MRKNKIVKFMYIYFAMILMVISVAGGFMASAEAVTTEIAGVAWDSETRDLSWLPVPEAAGYTVTVSNIVVNDEEYVTEEPLTFDCVDASFNFTNWLANTFRSIDTVEFDAIVASQGLEIDICSSAVSCIIEPVRLDAPVVLPFPEGFEYHQVSNPNVASVVGNYSYTIDGAERVTCEIPSTGNFFSIDSFDMDNILFNSIEGVASTVLACFEVKHHLDDESLADSNYTMVDFTYDYNPSRTLLKNPVIGEFEGATLNYTADENADKVDYYCYINGYSDDGSISRVYYGRLDAGSSIDFMPSFEDIAKEYPGKEFRARIALRNINVSFADYVASSYSLSSDFNYNLDSLTSIKAGMESIAPLDLDEENDETNENDGEEDEAGVLEGVTFGSWSKITTLPVSIADTVDKSKLECYFTIEGLKATGEDGESLVEIPVADFFEPYVIASYNFETIFEKTLAEKKDELTLADSYKINVCIRDKETKKLVNKEIEYTSIPNRVQVEKISSPKFEKGKLTFNLPANGKAIDYVYVISGLASDGSQINIAEQKESTAELTGTAAYIDITNKVKNYPDIPFKVKFYVRAKNYGSLRTNLPGEFFATEEYTYKLETPKADEKPTVVEALTIGEWVNSTQLPITNTFANSTLKCYFTVDELPLKNGATQKFEVDLSGLDKTYDFKKNFESIYSEYKSVLSSKTMNFKIYITVFDGEGNLLAEAKPTIEYTSTSEATEEKKETTKDTDSSKTKKESEKKTDYTVTDTLYSMNRTDGEKTGKEIWEATKDKSIPVEITAKKIVWHFDKVEKVIDMDPSIELGKASDGAKAVFGKVKWPESTKHAYITFAHDGEIPGIAKITLDLTDQGDFVAGDTIYLYYYNPTTNKLEYLNKNILGSDNKVQLSISHCSEYVVTNSQTSDGSVEASTISPKTGDFNNALSKFFDWFFD